jgi:hypothetical protein
VPAQQSGRLDEAPSLAKAREQSPQAGQDCPVGWLKRQRVDLASEYLDLVAQHDDLDGEVGVLAAGEPDQLKDANERPVHKREGHRRMLSASVADVQVHLTARGLCSRHPLAVRHFVLLKSFWACLTHISNPSRAFGFVERLIDRVAGATASSIGSGLPTPARPAPTDT